MSPLKNSKASPSQVLAAGGGLLLLISVYVFQRHDYASAFFGFFGIHPSPNMLFVFNKTFRFLLNDIACFLLIFAIFKSKQHVKLAFYLFLIELLIILPAYFVIKLALEGPTELSSPLLSQIHRLIVNPMLMIILIAGFLYQSYLLKRR